MYYHGKIIRDKNICGGDPVIKGTRIPLRTILASLAEGDSPEDISNDFPSLTEDDIKTVVAFAAASAEEDLPVAELPDITWNLNLMWAIVVDEMCQDVEMKRICKTGGIPVGSVEDFTEP